MVILPDAGFTYCTTHNKDCSPTTTPMDYYGTPTPIQQVGNISVPEARMILIQPWEKSLIRPIEKAIQTSELGINPSNDGSVIRLVFPELTEERRKELAKDVKKKGDGAKVAIRNIRRDANEDRKSTRLNSSHITRSRMPSSA